MMPDSEWTTALVEQSIAEMSDQEFDALVIRTRAPKPHFDYAEGRRDGDSC
jgi:hypothetical protein